MLNCLPVLFSVHISFSISVCRWAEVEEEERSVGVANRTEVRKFAGKLNEIILEYVRTLREFQDYQLKVIG